MMATFSQLVCFGSSWKTFVHLPAFRLSFSMDCSASFGPRSFSSPQPLKRNKRDIYNFSSFSRCYEEKKFNIYVFQKTHLKTAFVSCPCRSDYKSVQIFELPDCKLILIAGNMYKICKYTYRIFSWIECIFCQNVSHLT